MKGEAETFKSPAGLLRGGSAFSWRICFVKCFDALWREAAITWRFLPLPILMRYSQVRFSGHVSTVTIVQMQSKWAVDAHSGNVSYRSLLSHEHGKLWPNPLCKFLQSVSILPAYMASTTAKVCFALLILHSFPYCLAQLTLALFGSSCLNAALIFTMVLEDQMISNG